MASFNLARAKNEQDKELEQLSSDAHERAMARRRRTLEISPGAGSPWEYKAIVGDYRQQRDANNFRAHEMKMLEQQGKNEHAVAEEKALGMIGQGSKASEWNSAAALGSAKEEASAKKYGFDTQKDIEEGKNATSLTETEKKMAGEKDVATTQAEAQKSVAQTKAEAEKAVAETNQQTQLAQMAMDKYKVDETAAREIAKIEAAKKGKSKEDKITIIKAAQSNGQIDVKTAMQMLEELEKDGVSAENTGGDGLDKWRR